MGRDGLVFVNVRKDIVKLKKEKNLAEAPFKEHGAGTSIRWSHCCVTGGPLDRPVFCELGKLYNKDSVIELLLDRKRAQIAAEQEEKSKSKKKKKKRRGKLVLKDNEIPTETHRACYHIRDMKDIKELRIKINPHWRKHVPYNTLALGKSNGSKCEQGFVKHAKFQCPITSADFNGSKQFFGIWCCGHTISEPVLRELRDSKKCPVCSKSYEKSDLIRINPIHPDHRKTAKELFDKRRKKAMMKIKLARKMKKEMKQRKKNAEMKNEIKRESESSSADDSSDSSVNTDSDSTSSCSSDDSEFERLKTTLAKKFKERFASRSRSSSPVVKGETKPDLVKLDDKQLDPGEIVVLDSDDEESRNARARMEARMRAQIEHRRLEEFESIIRGKNKKSEPKKKRKRPIKDPTPIVLSD